MNDDGMCPYSKKECIKVDTYGMDKTPCEECEIFIQHHITGIGGDEQIIADQNEFMMGL